MKTLNSLQLSRAIAAWLVVYHHYMQGFHNFQWSTPAGHFFTTVGKFGVDIFFVISGFIMYYTLARGNYTASEFVRRRLLRIVPAYWIATLAFLAVLHVFPSPFTSLFGWNLSSLALSLLFIPHANPAGIGQFPLLTIGWTLNYEMFFYVWLSLMLFLFRSAWFFSCALSMIVLPLFWQHDWPYSAILSSSLLYEFVIGMFVGHLYLRAEALGKSRSASVGTILLLGGGLLYWAGAMHWSILDFSKTPYFWRWGDLTYHFSAAIFVCAALAFEQQVSTLRMLRALRYLGDMSYSTYLVHPIALCIAVYVLGQPQTLPAELFALCVYTAMTLVLSHVSYRWIETGPLMDFLKGALIASQGGRTAGNTQG